MSLQNYSRSCSGFRPVFMGWPWDNVPLDRAAPIFANGIMNHSRNRKRRAYCLSANVRRTANAVAMTELIYKRRFQIFTNNDKKSSLLDPRSPHAGQCQGLTSANCSNTRKCNQKKNYP